MAPGLRARGLINKVNRRPGADDGEQKWNYD
jgi:hypothetical protein